MKTVELECEICNNKFDRLEKEAKRCAKKGFSITCGMKCAGVMRNRKSPKSGNVENFGDKAYKKTCDEFSLFRYFIRKAKTRDKDKGRESDITLEYLKNLWEHQKGICPYTSHEMILGVNKTPFAASLDRVDSSVGYIQGNVEFVCLAVNLAKKDFSREAMMDFFKPILKE